MKVEQRRASDHELRRRYEGLSWFARRQRRIARAEAAVGLVEVLTFEVTRAWKLFSCGGAPCCPHEWLLETPAGEFVQLHSWSALRPTEDGSFPGRLAVATRWPQSRRLIEAMVSGDAVPVEPSEADDVIDLGLQQGECAIILRDELPLRFRTFAGSP
jgi:hypothetical protein